jgi:DNA-binding LacI/PurR family transcriptional regulator
MKTEMRAVKPPTIRDVALLAGVAESTVSRVLTGAETSIAISEDTRQRVLQAASDLAYRAHPGARALRGKGTNLLGVIVREFDDAFFSRQVDAFVNVAREAGYDLMLGSAKGDPEQAVALSGTLNMRYCDGLVLLGDLQETPEDLSFLKTLSGQVPLVLVCRGSGELVGENTSVTMDNRLGARLVLDYLAELGHQRIAFIGSARLGDLHERGEAYAQFMTAQIGGVPAGYLQLVENALEEGYQAMTRLLALPQPPTAVFAADDNMAIGAMKAAAEHGVAVPADLSIVGFDDIKIAAYLHPALTTVHQPYEEIACQAVELLLEMIRDRAIPQPAPHVVIPPQLVKRDSCAPPKNDRHSERVNRSTSVSA